jgi:hypothetical protein
LQGGNPPRCAITSAASCSEKSGDGAAFSFLGDRLSKAIPTCEPDVLRAGDTWKWTRSFSDYPVSEGWVLSYSIRGASVLVDADVVVTPGTNDYAVVVAAAKTAALLPGTYQWAAFVTKAGERYTADEGVLVVERNLSTAAAGDALSHAEKMLSIVEAVLAGRVPADVDSYQINGKSVVKIPVPELKKLRKQYRTEIWRLRNGNRLGPAHVTVFSRASHVS